MILIDAHGPDHGLYIDITRREVTIRQWCEADEPDPETGECHKHICEAQVSLAALVAHWRKHHRSRPRTKSMRDKIVDLALAWFSYYGGEETPVDQSDNPCQHFCMNYTGIGARRSEPWPKHMTCELCGGKPE